jgi:putative tricarboxylic transport membrane protein
MTTFLTRPISATLLAIAVLALIGPRLWAMARRRA